MVVFMLVLNLKRVGGVLALVGVGLLRRTMGLSKSGYKHLNWSYEYLGMRVCGFRRCVFVVSRFKITKPLLPQ